MSLYDTSLELERPEHGNGGTGLPADAEMFLQWTADEADRRDAELDADAEYDRRAREREEREVAEVRAEFVLLRAELARA
jgi:hypothetical protein